ncbi:MAG: S8 family serine peptidase [Salinivirgaceae bacterium]|nr:S8 family serine peptidase [Salinivirgaceae bacterium]
MLRKANFICVLFYCFLIILPNYSIAQTKEQKQKIKKETNIKELKLLNKKYDAVFNEEKVKALKLAKEKGWVVKEEKNGVLIELMKVSKEGFPIYYTTFNANAAISTRANTLHNGGLLGLNLEGQGMSAHVWDGGIARSSHQEYDGIGGEDRFSIGDGSTELHYHSAHVTGTIIASGVNEDAKGMAPQGHVVGFDWNNDLAEAAEMASNGMLLSNHSYGWRASDLADWVFGAYIGDSRDWDELLYNAPYYLMCVAAGNDGDDNVSNGAPLGGDSYFDKLSSHATAKNNLVVANAKQIGIDASGNLVSININSSSSEGPTDDYRIKPEIAGNGTNLYSTLETSNSAYGSLTGTSMATPNVCGTLLLLQQHYNNLNSNFMKAATLKGLALHTADDAGPAGPDAAFGWGLLNGMKAAEVISNRFIGTVISELSLDNNQKYTIDVFATGTEDLVVSISWTDLPGTINEGTANLATPALVNDLDVRVTESTNIFYPFRLSSLTTSVNADNNVDPFEKIIISNPTPGVKYTIQISHKGTLAVNQNFSLIISGIDGSSPNSLSAVSNNPNQIDLSWNSNNNNDDVMVAWSSDGIFGDPINQTTYNVADAIPNGGTILYKGEASLFNHSSLTENTHYYYKMWSVLPSGDYSAGVYSDETTIKSTPSNYPTLFVAGTPTGTTIPLTWTDAIGTAIPDGYLIKGSAISYEDIALPTDGILEIDSRFVKNINSGIQAVTIDSLTGETSYFFKIYPYTNSGSNIKYKTDGTSPEATAQTEVDPCVGLTLPYSENFDSGADCWNGVTGNDDWANVTPTTPSGDHTGGGTCFVTNGNNDYNTNSIYNLMSPKISLYGFGDCLLTFWIYMNAELSGSGDYWDGGYIECYDGVRWTKVTTSLPYNGNLSSGNPLNGELAWSPESILNWTQVTVDLSAYNENPDFQFRIRFGSDGAAVGAGWAIDDVSIYGTETCTPPTNQATNFNSSNVTYSSIDVSWDRGTPSGGDNVLVIACDVNDIHSDPNKGDTYTANSVFGAGDEIGVGNYVVYNGSGTSVNITGLDNITAYIFSVYEYSLADYCYNLIELSGTDTTGAKPEPTTQVTDFIAGTPSPTTIPLSWIDASGDVEPDGYLILANKTGVFIDPSDLNFVSDDVNLYDGSGAFNISQGVENYIFDGLNNATTYYFKIYSYTNSGLLVNYKTDGNPLEDNETTLSDPCTINLSVTAYTENFDAVTAPNLPSCISVENTNNDDYEWIIASAAPYSGSNHLSIRWNSSIAMNDWFFSPPLQLQAGFEYEVTFWYRSESSSYTEKLEVMLGTQNNSASMTLDQIFDNSSISSTSYVEAQATFTASADGIYYIGWHGYSDLNQWSLYIDDVSVVKGLSSNIDPIVENAIADTTIKEGFVSSTLDLSTVFSDSDGDDLTYSAVSDNTDVVTLNVSGNILTINEIGIGMANITVTANDGNGGLVQDVFSFTIEIGDAIESQESNKIHIYPNPAKAFIKLDFDNVNIGDVFIEVTDINGQKVFVDKVSTAINNEEYLINSTNYSKGIYFIKISCNKFIRLEKIIIE